MTSNYFSEFTRARSLARSLDVSKINSLMNLISVCRSHTNYYICGHGQREEISQRTVTAHTQLHHYFRVPDLAIIHMRAILWCQWSKKMPVTTTTQPKLMHRVKLAATNTHISLSVRLFSSRYHVNWFGFVQFSAVLLLLSFVCASHMHCN